MAQELTFNITEDTRRLKRPTSVKDFQLSFGHADQGPTDVVIGDDGNIVQGRYGDSARQVFVNVVQGKNNEPVDITGYLPEFNGCIPDAEHIVIDNWDGVLVDPRHGRFRFDFPIQAFTVAGSYKQAYFRLVQNGTGKTLATLEFDMQVLEDFVYSNIVPQDYVTPYLDMINKLKDAYTNFVSKTQDSFDQAKKRLDDIMSTVEDKADTVEQRLKIDEQALAELSKKIDEKGLFTQAEADAFKQAIVDQMAKLFEQAKAAVSDKQVATNMANFALAQGDNYTLSLPPYDQDSFTHATTVPHGESIVNVAFITDNHWQEDGNDIFDNSDGYAYHSLQHYQWFAEGTLTSKPDIVIADGDNVNGDDNRTSNIYTTRHVKAMLDSCYIKSSIFMIPGNHDLGIGQFDGSKKPGMVMSNDDLKSTYGTKPCRFGEVRNGDSLYFYKDLPDKKVRIIGLNSSDGPMTTGADGNYIWDAINVHVFSAEQLSWLVEKALVLPDTSWQVAIFFHAPIGKAFGGWDKESTSTINSDCLLDILTAFKNGTSTTCNSANSLAPITGLAADFTKQGKGTIIGIFNGHFHKDMQDLSTLNGTPMIETDASLTSQHNQARYNTINEDCWETISIDTAKRTIHCYRFGRGQDREFNY